MGHHISPKDGNEQEVKIVSIYEIDKEDWRQPRRLAPTTHGLLET